MMSAQITQQHLTRDACIYIRQSTMAQVYHNQESAQRQYDLKNKAQALGWSLERIRILDRDLGQSGAHSAEREDFNVLVGDVAMGRVGAIFALEASRFARSNLDWLRLLELCAITNTLVVDEDGCYNPADFNDGLVLGLKGTFAQAELHIIRARLHGGRLKKASRGDLRIRLPVGLVFDEAGRVVFDPDQEVQGAVRMAFDLFEREGSAYGVVRCFCQLGLRFPQRTWGGVHDGKLNWGRLTYSRVLRLLANPAYAGIYVFGRLQVCKTVTPAGEVRLKSHYVAPEDWKICLPDHHCGYISGEQFLANRRKLESNRLSNEAGILVGPAREGLCLLQGLLVCAVCGRRLNARYTGKSGIYTSYLCRGILHAPEGRPCLTVKAAPLDQAISDRVITAVTPMAVELSLKALDSLHERDKEVLSQWHRRIERARYEVDLAERRYEVIDPANRLVAATLEQRWNDAMQRLRNLEAELAQFERQRLRTVTPEQKEQIRQLVADFPKLWQAETTKPRDRKRLLRLMVRDITVTRDDNTKQVHMDIRWQGGATERLSVNLPLKRCDAIRYPEEIVARIRSLALTLNDRQIAERLTIEGLIGTTGKTFNANIVRMVRHNHNIPVPAPPDGSLSVKQLCQRYGVSPYVVYDWIKGGVINSSQSPSGPHNIHITDETDRLLRNRVANSTRIHSPSQPPDE
ncbi:MAG: recombinase family protein [Rhodospirillaceae bacterium]